MQFKKKNITITFKGLHVPLPESFHLPLEITMVLNFVVIISCLFLQYCYIRWGCPFRNVLSEFLKDSLVARSFNSCCSPSHSSPLPQSPHPACPAVSDLWTWVSKVSFSNESMWKDTNSFVTRLLSFCFTSKSLHGLNLFTWRFGDMEMAVG